MSYVELLAWCMENTIDLCKRQPFDGYSIIFYDFLRSDNWILWFNMFSMVFLWVFYGLLLSFLYGFLPFSMVPLYSFRVFMAFHWSIRGNLWLFYGFSMVYYWFSMIFYGFYEFFYATNLTWKIHKPCVFSPFVFSPRHKCQLLWLCEFVNFFS